ncbi:MAG TPA: hypothetical protein ENK50_06435 [Sedimenticola sp.]|nr:hypothetical protein [Sedimenticola sp.]
MNVTEMTRVLLLVLLFAVNGIALAGGLLLDASHGGGGSAWGLKKCIACHPANRIHRDAPGIRGIVRRKGYATCAGCHGDNGSGARRRCIICHNGEDLPGSPHRDGLFRHEFQGSGIPEGDSECLTCHEAADMDGLFEPDRDLTLFPYRDGYTPDYFTTSDFCLRCHNRDHQVPGFEIVTGDPRDPLVAMEDNHERVDFHGRRKGRGDRIYSGLRPDYRYPEVVPCTDCHSVHGTANPSLLMDRQQKGASGLSGELAEKDHPVEIVDGEYAQLCVICHAMEADLEEGYLDTGNGLSGVHRAFGDCRECHRHGLGAQAGL